MLYIMRHGTTEWNVLHKLQGRTDIPLNAGGRALAAQVRETYRDVHLDICYCSPLCRARETAEIFLHGRDIPICPDDRLVEMCFGSYEGVENSLGQSDLPIGVLFRQPEAYVPADGVESLDALFARTGAFLEEVVLPQVQEGRDILIVGHGAMNASIICRLRGLPRAEFWSAGLESCKLIRLL